MKKIFLVSYSEKEEIKQDIKSFFKKETAEEKRVIVFYLALSNFLNCMEEVECFCEKLAKTSEGCFSLPLPRDFSCRRGEYYGLWKYLKDISRKKQTISQIWIVVPQNWYYQTPKGEIKSINIPQNIHNGFVMFEEKREDPFFEEEGSEGQIFSLFLEEGKVQYGRMEKFLEKEKDLKVA